jgi:tetratricopeptide (TPR) repeat protein
MKEFYLKIIFLLSILAFFFSTANAQRSNGLTVEGKVTTEEGSVDGAFIQIFRDGQRMTDYGIGSNGRYKMELNYNHEFILVFSRPDNFSQKIVVSTLVPQNVLQSDPLFPPFQVDVNLYTKIPGIDDSFSENTTMEIFYDSNADNFFSETYYNNAQIKNLIDQAILQSQMIDKEADYLSKLTKAELAELKKEYDELLDDANKDFSNEKFLDALDGYEAASRIFPNEQYPKDRIAEINDLLGMLMVAEEMQKARAQRLQDLLKQADLQYSQLNYHGAKNLYSRALSIDPNNQLAITRVAEIDDLLLRQQTAEEYNKLIALADNALKEMLYEEAKNNYSQALELRKNESYPQQKIDEINGILSKQAKSLADQESYKQAMFEAEVSFEKQFYDKAIASYENALSYRPEDPVATRKIAEVKNLMQQLANKSLYDRFIKSADRAYKKEDYKDALADYTEAIKLIPGDEYALGKISAINAIIQGDKVFDNLIAQADEAFDNQDYSNSKNLYTQALEIYSENEHALERLDEIEQIFAIQQQNNQYNEIISQADQLFNQNNYEDATSLYQKALKIKSRENYPQQQLDEIANRLAALASAQEAYDAAIAQADREFNRESFDAATTSYNRAKEVKPEETYPDEMLAKIDSIITTRARLAAEAEAAEQARLAALQAEQDSMYNVAIASADQFFNAEEYENARTQYNAALDIKPEETYPQQQLDEIASRLAALASAQEAYNAAIAQGDIEFNRESFDAATTSYNRAKEAKPEETYPDEMLAKIDSIITTRARLAAEAAAAEQARLAALQAEQDSLYNAAIASADQFFNVAEYENSRTQYNAALTIKPEEVYPQQQIQAINNILEELAALQREMELLNKNYQDAIQLADNFFEVKNLPMAKSNYEKASNLKPEENYPLQQIEEIDRLLKQQEIDEQYRRILVAADGYFNSESFENAKNEYQNALSVKPEEQYPKNQISKIDNLLAERERQILAQQQAAEDLERRREEISVQQQIERDDQILSDTELTSLYNSYIASADNYFNGKLYNVSRAWYYKAWDVKPEELYPQQRIEEINRIISGLMQNQRDRDYQQFVNLGDSTFRENQLAVARGWYNQALSIKANEEYPRDQLQEIENLIAERLAGQSGQQFEENVGKAENAMQTENYNVARFWYKKALELRPNDVEVQNKLREIEEIIRQ